MANNQQLPRPNIPKAAQQQAKGPSQTPPQQAQPQVQAQASVPAGLDPNSPGGAPPKLDDKGRVVGPAAQISGTREMKQFGQHQATTLSNNSIVQPQQDLVAKQQPMIMAATGGSSGQTQPPRMVKQALPGQLLQQQTQDQQNRPQIGQVPGAPNSSNQQQGAKPPISGGVQAQTQVKTISPDQQKSRNPVFVKGGSKLKKFLPFIVGGVAVVAVVIFVLTKVLGGGGDDVSEKARSDSNSGSGSSSSESSAAKTSSGQKTTLTYWGLWEPNTVLQEVFADFKKQNPNIEVNYVKQSHQDYLSRLKSAIASGNGPDIYRFHATWTPALAQELSPLPTKIMSANEFEQTFYPVMKQQLQVGGQLAGIPLMYDGLGLYYNKKILASANEEVPKTWGQLKTLAERLVVSPDGEMKRGGLAIGNTTNVEHWADIIGLLIYQNEGNPLKPMTSEVRDALRYYNSFNEDPVFSTKLPSSTVAFAREEVAMMFAPSWRAHEVLSLNPELEFGIAPVPKLSEKKIGWASYWAEGVSSKSKNQESAWQLLKYLSSKEVMQKLYSSQSQIRAFGEIYPRRDLAEAVDSEYVTAYLLDAENAQSAPLCSFTHDKTFNDQIINYYQDAVNGVGSGTSDATEDLQILGRGISQILRQYNINVSIE